jgi:type I site-specific restriction endonuclease
MVGRGTRPHPASGKADCLVVDFDWETDPEAKDICAVVELFDDGSLDDETLAVAKQLARAQAEQRARDRAARPADTDPMDLIEQAEEIVRVRRTLHVSLSGRNPKYEVVETDPVGVTKLLDVSLNRKYDLDRKGTNPASSNQLSYLRRLGVDAPESLSKWGASKLIDKLAKREKAGLASIRQVQTLLAAGVNEDLARHLSREQASTYIQAVDAARPKTQGMLFR